MKLYALLLGLGLLAASLPGCRSVVEAKHPSGKPKVIRTYGFLGLGGKTPENLRRERTFHFNGNPEKDARYRGGRLHGPYQDFWHNGQRKTQGEYADGKKQGPWAYYYNQYSVAAKGEFQDGLKEGRWVEAYEDGSLKAEGEYRRGRETGVWKRWSAKGELLEENSCFETNPEGRTLTYHAGNTPKEEFRCRRGVPTGAYVRKNVYGEVAERGAFDSAGRKDGVWETFHPGLVRASRRAYRSGTAVDSLLEWDPAGRVRKRGHFREGIGEVASYDSLGRLIERRRMAGGRPEGEAWTFYPEGGRKSLMVYRDGQPVLMRKWHANGKPAAEGAFAGGKRTGEWKQFGEAGQVLERSQYVKGRLHGERRIYDSTGKAAQVIRYEHGYPAEGRFPGGLKEQFPVGTGTRDSAGEAGTRS